MSFNQPDPANAPELSMHQQFEKFVQMGWKPENFAIQTNPIGQTDKVVVIEMYPQWWAKAFLGRMIRINTETTTSVNRVLLNIAITRNTLEWKKRAQAIEDLDEILGENSIGNRYRRNKRTSQKRSIPA